MVKINESFERYSQALNNVNDRRAFWQESAKKTIKERLEFLKKNLNIDGHVQSFASAINLEVVNLSLNKKHSGIIVKDDNGTKAYVKESGYIAFSQAYNGMVHVIASLPCIEGITGQSDGKLLASIDPTDVTAELVDDYVEQFFDLLTTWETGK